MVITSTDVNWANTSATSPKAVAEPTKQLTHQKKPTKLTHQPTLMSTTNSTRSTRLELTWPKVVIELTRLAPKRSATDSTRRVSKPIARKASESEPEVLSRGLVFDLGPSNSWDDKKIGSPVVKKFLSTGFTTLVLDLNRWIIRMMILWSSV